jgi:hypothetical protein
MCRCAKSRRVGAVVPCPSTCRSSSSPGAGVEWACASAVSKGRRQTCMGRCTKEAALPGPSTRRASLRYHWACLNWIWGRAQQLPVTSYPPHHSGLSYRQYDPPSSPLLWPPTPHPRARPSPTQSSCAEGRQIATPRNPFCQPLFPSFSMPRSTTSQPTITGFLGHPSA